MPVDALHPQYSQFSDRWQKCRDAMAGEEAVKAGRERYLPRLSGQLVPEYDQYLGRALYFNASGRTRDAYVGLVFSKDVEISCPEEKDAKGQPVQPPPPNTIKALVDAFEDDFTQSHLSLWGAAKLTVREVLEAGRCGWLVDVSDPSPTAHGEPVFYKAEDIVNWRTEVRVGGETLVRVVLREHYEEATEDEFVFESAVRYRVLRLNDQGVYNQQVYTLVRKNDKEVEWVGGPEITPTRQGEPLREIPFVFVGPNNCLSSVDRPPLEDLVDVNISHFRTSADLENARHWTAVPTPIFLGFDFKPGQEVKIGSAGGITGPKDAKAEFLEYSGQGLEPLAKASQEKKDYMYALGARLLRDEQKPNETAEAARIRSTGESATLASIANSVSEALTLVLRLLVWWAGVDDVSEIEIALNTQFVDTKVDAQTLTALIAARQSGLISQETFLWNLQKGNMIDPSISLEQEMDRLESAPPAGAARIALEDGDGPMPGKGGGKEDAKGPKGSPSGANTGVQGGESQGKSGQVVKV